MRRGLLIKQVVGAFVIAVSLAACGGPGPSPSATTPPSVPPTTSASPPPTTAGPSPNESPHGVVVTFDVVGEQFRILLTDAEDIAIAQQLLAGADAPGIPSGLIVHGETGVNTGYSWSIDPESVEFADFTTEVCDGLPSQIEDGTFTFERFCPWSAEVAAIDPSE